MKKQMNTMRVIMVSFALLILSTFSNALLVMNDITCSFPPGQEKETIENEIVEGAKSFLLAQSTINLLLFEYEKSATETYRISTSRTYAEKASAELKDAISHYQSAIKIAEQIGYNEAKKEKFTSYNYDYLIESEKLNVQIAEIVKERLLVFDIIGLYKDNLKNINDILELVKSIKMNLDNMQKPSLFLHHSLIQRISETTLMANYATILGSGALEQCKD